MRQTFWIYFELYILVIKNTLSSHAHMETYTNINHTVIRKKKKNSRKFHGVAILQKSFFNHSAINHTLTHF